MAQAPCHSYGVTLFYDSGRHDLSNLLPNDKIADVTKLKAFADGKLNVARIMIPLVDRVE